MKRKYWVVIACILVLLVIAAGINFAKLSPYRKAIASIEIGDVDLSRVPDGVYEGFTDTILVSARVRVTVENHKIVNIELLKHDHGRGEPAEALINKVEEEQSLKVDFISGATSSSKVILKAIENALTGN